MKNVKKRFDHFIAFENAIKIEEQKELKGGIIAIFGAAALVDFIQPSVDTCSDEDEGC